MKTMYKEKIHVLSLLFLLFFWGGCKTLSQTKPVQISFAEPYVESNDVKITYVPKKGNAIAYLIFDQKSRLIFPQLNAPVPFKRDLILDHNMRNVRFLAKVKKDGRTLREFVAQKTNDSIVESNNKAFVSNISKLSLAIPYVSSNEEVELTLSYEWMDARFLRPILMEDLMFTRNAHAVLEIPHGITMHFQASQNKKSLDMAPTSTQVEKEIWGVDKQKYGLGTKYVFAYKNDGSRTRLSDLSSDRLKLFLAFEPAFYSRTNDFFDSWHKISSFLYNKIDRLDVPNSAIKDFTLELLKDLKSNQEKISSICSFLASKIELRKTDESFQYQDAQPASKTFQKKAGSPLDIVLLGKAMLLTANIPSDIIAVGNRDFDPKISFFTPSIFHDVILGIFDKEKTYYFDPNRKFDNLWHLDPNFQGQNALLLSNTKGYLFFMPYDAPEKNIRNMDVELDLSATNPSRGFFSLNLSGAWANLFKENVDITQSIIDPIKAQKTFIKSDNALRVMELQKEQVEEDESKLIFSGSFQPFSLSRAESKLSLSLYPLLSPLNELLLEDPDFSSITEINITIGLPEGFVIEEALGNYSYSDGGRFFHVSVTPLENKFNIKANATIALPLSDVDSSKEYAGFLENLKKPLILKPISQNAPNPEQGPLFEDKDEANTKENPH